MILILSLAFFLLIPTSLTSQAKLILFWMQKDYEILNYDHEILAGVKSGQY